MGNGCGNANASTTNTQTDELAHLNVLQDLQVCVVVLEQELHEQLHGNFTVKNLTQLDHALTRRGCSGVSGGRYKHAKQKQKR